MVVRFVLYWAEWIITVAVWSIFWRIVTSAANQFDPRWDEMWFTCQPVVLASLMLLPLTENARRFAWLAGWELLEVYELAPLD